MIVVAAAEEIGPALADHGTDVRAAIHDEDVAWLYVEVEGLLAERAVLELRGTGDAEDPDGDRGGLRGSVPVSAARSLVERSLSSRSTSAPAT